MTTYEMAPSEMTFGEINEVSGGGIIADSTGIGGGAGAAVGIIVTNTARGAATGGAVGAALGFAFGAGFAVGTGIVHLFGIGFRQQNAR
jgi:hypothetical protein